jgi:hypothetical protein
MQVNFCLFHALLSIFNKDLNTFCPFFINVSFLTTLAFSLKDTSEAHEGHKSRFIQGRKWET